jgi:ribosomal protein S18 acetylase RimI-like enzyme
MHIRRLAPPDRDPIERLLRSDGTFHEDELTVAMELVDDALKRPDVDYRVIVAVDVYVGGASAPPNPEDERVLGYVCYGPTPMTQSTWDLYWVATDRLARGRGVATRLVASMEAEVHRLGGRRVRIETSQLEAYGSARSLYARLAYHEAGRIPDFYRPGDDLIILCKRLDLAAQLAEPRPTIMV